MFNIGIGEMLFIAILALLILGPERLPKVMREVGELVAQVRGIVNELNSQFSDELKPLREIQGLANDLNPMKQIGSVMSPIATDGAKSKPVSDNSIAPPQKSQAQATAPAPAAPNPIPAETNAVANPMSLISQTRLPKPAPGEAGAGSEQAANNTALSAPENLVE